MEDKPKETPKKSPAEALALLDFLSRFATGVGIHEFCEKMETDPGDMENGVMPDFVREHMQRVCPPRSDFGSDIPDDLKEQYKQATGEEWPPKDVPF